jgi:hypothetical protein
MLHKSAHKLGRIQSHRLDLPLNLVIEIEVRYFGDVN